MCPVIDRVVSMSYFLCFLCGCVSTLMTPQVWGVALKAGKVLTGIWDPANTVHCGSFFEKALWCSISLLSHWQDVRVWSHTYCRVTLLWTCLHQSVVQLHKSAPKGKKVWVTSMTQITCGRPRGKKQALITPRSSLSVNCVLYFSARVMWDSRFAVLFHTE